MSSPAAFEFAGHPVADAIHQLWDRLADFSFSATDLALEHLMASLCGLFDSQVAAWSASVRIAPELKGDLLGGWRPRVCRQLGERNDVERSFEDAVKRLARSNRPDITTINNAALAGTFRAVRLCDLAPTEWFESDFYKAMYLARGMADAVYVAFPISADVESYLLLGREPGRPPFSEQEREQIGYAFRGLKWLHRRALLGYGLLAASQPLTVTERRVMRELLTGQTEKELAESLALSIHTVRDHIAAIYRKFGVTNRASLMALWSGPML